MKIVRVQYTVRPEYVEANRARIRAVMEDLRAHPIEGMRYATFLLPDGQTFMHLNLSDRPEALEAFNRREAFRAFRSALRESGPVTPPKAEELELVGASFDVF